MKEIKVALIGNPNVGKTSVFNLLTGMNQKVGNYPGVTVSKKTGVCKLSPLVQGFILDLPGTYSANPNSLDEKIAVESLLNTSLPESPDVVVYVADVENLKQNLLLFTQIKSLNVPVILAINMADRMQARGITLNIPLMENLLQTKIVLLSTRQNRGLQELKDLILIYQHLSTAPLLDISKIDTEYFFDLKKSYPNHNLYGLWLQISQHYKQENMPSKEELFLQGFNKNERTIKQMQHREAIVRYQFINEVLKQVYKVDKDIATGWEAALDKILLHKVMGYAFFILILLLIFEVLYSISGLPMAWLEDSLDWVKYTLAETLPTGAFTSLLLDGVLEGIKGVVVFVPQIALLFLFIGFLEESGYMSRVVFLMDRLVRPLGLNGKSVVPLLSGVACAVPAVMSARTIENWRERLITILVTPFMACSARLPVYLIMIEIVIPEGKISMFSYKALTLLALYIAGVLMALLSAYILHKVLHNRTFKNHFIVEMPLYKLPLWRNVWTTMYESSKAFVIGAGKVILSISVIIWFLQSHGFSAEYKNAESTVQNLATQYNWNEAQTAHHLAGLKSEHSLLGNLGKAIEPVFAPLGYDWKISVAVLASFAAREVFIGTLAIIYNLGKDISESFEDDDNAHQSIVQTLQRETLSDGTPVFTLATGVSILIFYAFAMQCVSTLAIVRKETNSWKWAFIQLVGMTSIAYLFAFLAYSTLK